MIRYVHSLALLLATWLAATGVFAASERYQTAVLVHTPIAFWRMNEAGQTGVTLVDSSGNARHGTFNPSRTDFSFRQMTTVGDRGIRLVTSTATIQSPDHATLDPSAITIEAVIKTGAIGSAQRIIEKSTTSGATQAQYGLTIDADGKLRFTFMTAGAQAVVTDTAVISATTAYHLAASYNGTDAKIYVNGVEVKSTAIAGTLATASAQPVVIGNILTGTAPFLGYIDEVSLYSSALSLANIQAHMAAVAQRAPLTIDTPRPDNAGLMTGSPSLTFAEVGLTGDTITRAAGNWQTDGFRPNDLITVSGTTSNNFSSARITAVTATVLTMDTQDLAAEVDATVTVTSTSGSLVTTTFPVQSGVPIPEEDLYSTTPVRLVDSVGTPVSAQFKVLGRWRKFGNGVYPSDSAISISWLQVAFRANVSLSSSAVYYVEYGPWTTNSFTGSMATVVGNDIEVNTGPTGVWFKVLRDFPTLFDQVRIDVDGDGTIEAGEGIVGPAATPHGLYFTDGSNNIYRAGFDNTGTTLVVEEDGPDQVTLKATGHYRLSGVVNADDNEWIVRIKAYKNKPFVRVYVTMVVHKDSPTRRYKDIGVELRMPATAIVAAHFADGYLAPRKFYPDPGIEVDYGPWTSRSVVTAPHNLTQRLGRHDSIRIFRDTVESSGGGHNRAGGWQNIAGTAASGAFNITTTMRWYWQQYPNGFEWHEDGADQLSRVHLWSRFATSGDASVGKQLSFEALEYLKGRGRHSVPEGHATGTAFDKFETDVQGCGLERYEYPADNATYSFDAGACAKGCLHSTGVGVSKTWELMYDFQRGALTSGTAATPPETAFLTQRPVLAVVDPTWLADSLAAGRVAPVDTVMFPEIDARPACTTNADCASGRKCRQNGFCQNYLDMYMDRLLLEQVVNGEESAPYGPTYPMDIPPDASDTREYGDSYGTFEFGDILHNGKSAHRYWLHHAYWVRSSFWLWYARSGDRRAFEFGEASARHGMDIDTNHVQYDFTFGCTSPVAYPGPRRMYKGTPRMGDLGIISWASNGSTAWNCTTIPGQGCDNTQLRIPMFSSPTDHSSYLARYYYLTGYERALDVANEISNDYMAVAIAHPAEGYWTQTESRLLGGGLLAVSELFGLLGGEHLETAAEKLAAEMIGFASGDELIANRICPRPKNGGLTRSYGTPFDGALSYMTPAAVAYVARANEANYPKASNVTRWIKDQALGIFDSGATQGSAIDVQWDSAAAAYFADEETDAAAASAALRPALTEYQSAKAQAWPTMPTAVGRSATIFKLPFLLAAIRDSATSVPTESEIPQVTSGGELQYNKLVPEDVEIIVRAFANPAASLPLFKQDTIIPALPTATVNVPYALNADAPDGGPRVCYSGSTYTCTAAIALYGPAGTELDRRAYPPGYTVTPPRCAQSVNQRPDSRTWYNGGGWYEKLTLRGPPGIYRARVEVDGVVSGQRVEAGANTTAINSYNMPLFQLSAARNDPNQAQVMGFAGNSDGVSPGVRYDADIPRYAYVPSGAVPVTFTFTHELGTTTLPFSAFLPGGGAATVGGGGSGVAWTVTVPGGDRNARWRFDLGPETKLYNFGFDKTDDCIAGVTPDSCKAEYFPVAGLRVFSSTGVYPYYANSTSNYFVPQLLSAPILMSPTGTSAGSPTTAFRWRAVPAAQEYRIGWTDGAYCGATNYETVTAADAHCAYGTGQCWLARTIASGRGTWFVQARSDLIDSAEWPWSVTQAFQYGTILPAPALPSVNTLSGQTFLWTGVSGATHYTIEIDDSSSDPLSYTTVTAAAAGCPSGGACQTTVATVFDSGPARWRVQANCSGNFSVGKIFVVP